MRETAKLGGARGREEQRGVRKEKIGNNWEEQKKKSKNSIRRKKWIGWTKEEERNVARTRKRKTRKKENMKIRKKLQREKKVS